MNRAHYGGPVAAVLANVRGRLRLDGEQHRRLVRAFAVKFGADNPVFRMERFIIRSGCSEAEAREMVREVWRRLLPETRQALQRSERFCYAAGRSWWRVGEGR